MACTFKSGTMIGLMQHYNSHNETQCIRPCPLSIVPTVRPTLRHAVIDSAPARVNAIVTHTSLPAATVPASAPAVKDKIDAHHALIAPTLALRLLERMHDSFPETSRCDCIHSFQRLSQWLDQRHQCIDKWSHFSGSCLSTHLMSDIVVLVNKFTHVELSSETHLVSRQ